MAEIFLHLVNMSITASWLIFAVIILRLLLKKAPKWIHCLLWCMVGLRLLLPISIESAFSLIPSAEPLPQEIFYENSLVIDSGVDSVNQTVNPVLQESFALNPGDSVNPLQIITFLASYIWVLGMMALLSYTVITYTRLKKSVGEAVRFQENIYQCEKVATPFVLGVVRPRIYLSYGLQGEELTCVISHEQAHIKRKDHLWKPLAFLILTVYWFNPLVWVAYILLCRDIEYACDEKVLATMGSNMKKTYATALLHCSVRGLLYDESEGGTRYKDRASGFVSRCNR
uniref:M56 family metallopeptidase n=1 Tax=Acetatifactor sp. TaxID=1872090 RepID=UPI004055C997